MTNDTARAGLPVLRLVGDRYTVDLDQAGFTNLLAALRDCSRFSADAAVSAWAGDFLDIATATVAAPATMTVRVRDRNAEAQWGYGLTRPVVRTVTIPARCPKCGGPRGEPRNLNQVDDGEHYSVDVWHNPCGHADPYFAVVEEAIAFMAQCICNPTHRADDPICPLATEKR